MKKVPWLELDDQRVLNQSTLQDPVRTTFAIGNADRLRSSLPLDLRLTVCGDVFRMPPGLNELTSHLPPSTQ
jgi:hypothetical protein